MGLQEYDGHISPGPSVTPFTQDYLCKLKFIVRFQEIVAELWQVSVRSKRTIAASFLDKVPFFTVRVDWIVVFPPLMTSNPIRINGFRLIIVTMQDKLVLPPHLLWMFIWIQMKLQNADLLWPLDLSSHPSVANTKAQQLSMTNQYCGRWYQIRKIKDGGDLKPLDCCISQDFIPCTQN